MEDLNDSDANAVKFPNVVVETTKIFVTFTLPGMHRYPEAPEEVAFLRNLHRHIFNFKVTLDVFHDDRELEFFMVLNWIKSLYGQELNVDYKSCEMLAKELSRKVGEKYGFHRGIVVEVSEDGECGAIVSSTPFHGARA